ncbi:succinate-semialdehyde dehydrogenase/glutarate-semialdehyde dehydrogenase [Desulfosoma caldarium]|uniref:Succinate-semialdehyde dehydrogenase/glutarate-semialdehyde dehydrogenase n=1 Tax=Desulfosoma caldarium TaxID=610254 RepID=A0A3N1UQU3_9BACT|nr:succinate-semialdehyde dehydrogenase/glutarate-semialdehyde dehydrogenase [Desulfosoma caldarium]
MDWRGNQAHEDVKEKFGFWVDGAEQWAEPWMAVVDPASEEPMATVPVCDAAWVDRAVLGASKAQKLWKETAPQHRRDVLRSLAERVRTHRESLTHLLGRETGKPKQAAVAEVDNTAHLIDYFAEEGYRLSGLIPLLGDPQRHTLVVREPLGVVGAITPFNYPLSTLACKAASALAVGCAVVAKPDEHTPLSTLALARIFTEAGLPSGLLQVVTGPGPVTGAALVDHPNVRGISFTGSTEVGKEIQRRAASSVKRLILELGGSCPAIVCHDADWRTHLPHMVAQAYKNSGQYCYRITRFYVARNVWKPFFDEFMARVMELRVGHPLNPQTVLGPLNHQGILRRVREQVWRLQQAGATVFQAPLPKELHRGFYFPPTVITNIEPQTPELHEEIFGPVTFLIPFDDEAQAIVEANRSPYGLAAYVFTQNLAKGLRLAHRLEAGSVWINGVHQALPEAPFGGMKESGLGREKSRFGVEAFTELKTLYLAYA